MEQVIANGLYLGAQYALIALGLTLIFSLMNVLNFAHGQMYVLGGFVTYTVVAQFELPFIVGLLASGLVLGAVGALVERFLFRPVIRKSQREESTMLLAAGIAFFLDAVILLVFGEKQRGVPKIIDGVFNWDFLIVMPYDRIAIGLLALAMVASRIVSQKAIDEMSEDADVAWITALRSGAIRALVEQKHLQLGLFDEHNLLELSSPDFPGERLVACRNPELAKLRAHTRDDLLLATEQSLQKIKARVEAAKLLGKDKIGVAVGKCVNRYKVAKHFELVITDDAFTFARIVASIGAEAALDGLYVIRTSVKAQRMDAPTCVRTYKSLAQVERAFRSLKTTDLKVRPIHHHLEGRVRGHIFLCMLAYYVEWHMREAWRELMFADCDQQAKLTRDPVAPAKRSEAAIKKVTSLLLEDGTPAHSFHSLMQDLSSITRNTCRTPNGTKEAPTFQITTTLTVGQKRAIELIDQIKP